MFVLFTAKRQVSTCSSGFIIDGSRILTNAHSIVFATSIRVRKHGESTTYTATVLNAGHECDLAVLTVESKEFWNGLPALQFGSIPRVQSQVSVLGYPVGGSNISITAGVVSRICMIAYSHSKVANMAIQIDAAVNPGNSGGPAIINGMVVGVTFELARGSQNVAYIVPTPVIQHYLESIKRFTHPYKVLNLGIRTQPVQNDSMKEYLKVSNRKHGSVIVEVSPMACSTGYLKRGDVLLAVDGKELGDDATVVLRDGEADRVSYVYDICLKSHDDVCKMTIWRDGKEAKIDIPMVIDKMPMDLVSIDMHDKLPSYYIWAGLVFTVCTVPYLVDEFGANWVSSAVCGPIVEKAFTKWRSDPTDELVILSHVLSHEVNHGYNQYTDIVVTSVNGVVIKNLKQLVDILESVDESTHPFVELQCNSNTDVYIVLNVNKAKLAQSSILEHNQIPCRMSRELADVYLKK